jgi:type II restriction/modification system DNA methylase subunit YeeA
MAPTLTPQQFVEKWCKVDLKEIAAYVSHFEDLCRLVGHQTPVEADPNGVFFTFQAGVNKQKGGKGWADVWKKGSFALEYKGKHANLDKAYDQLLQYREALQNPPLLVVSDMERILIHTNFTNTVKKIYEITYDSLLTTAGFQRLQDMFTNPEAFHVAQTTEQVTLEVAKQFAKLAENLRKWKHEPADIAHFLIRLLFCLFAEDVELLPKGLFSQLVTKTNRNVTAFSQRLKMLFGAMATGGPYGNDTILYFNGRLFDNDRVIDLDSESIDVLVKVSQLDWSSIEPAIFGTLFERSLDPAKRSQLGAHYTSKEDILLIVEPVLMAPLRQKWAKIQIQARELETQRDQAAPKQQAKITSQMQELITGFAGEIAQVKVLDPACGSGNFLYVALKQLLDLEKEVITFAGNIGLTRPFPQVDPEQLLGIEINEYAHELAQITVWIGYIQWLRDNGFGRPSEPILKPLNTIKHMDAIVASDENGQLYEPNWPEADAIIGNPPFLGGKRLRAELSDEYVNNIFKLYEGRVPREADLVIYWFERARKLIETGIIKRAGLLSTNSIRQPQNRFILNRIKQSGDIFMAWADREWVLNGAAVRVSIVGFDGGKESTRMLDGQPATSIHSNLTSLTNLTMAQRLPENANIAFMGDTKGGAFDVTADVAKKLITSHGNPHGKPNINVVRPWVNGLDITRRPRDMWIIDFGTNMSEGDAALYEKPFEYIRENVKPERMTNNRAAYRDRWWIHVEPRPALRNAIEHLHRYIVTPSVAKFRLFAWLEHPTIADHKLFVIARDDD